MRCIKAAMFTIVLMSAAKAGEFSCNSVDGELNRCALQGANKMKVRLKLDR